MAGIVELQRYLDDGFVPGMAILDPRNAKQLDFWCSGILPDLTAVTAIPLRHSDNRKMILFLHDYESANMAERLVAKQKEVIGYNVCIYLSAIGPEAIKGKVVCLDSIAESVRTLLHWPVKLSSYSNTLEITIAIDNNRVAVDQAIEQVKQLALVLTIKNKDCGFVAEDFSLGEMYRGQPFSIKCGLQEMLAKGVNNDEWAQTQEVWRNEDARAAAEALQAIYLQVSDKTRLMAAWAAIEEFFDSNSKPEHLLSADELKELIKAVANTGEISEDNRNRLVGKLKDANWLNREDRNSRVARNITDALGGDRVKVYEQVKSLSQARAKSVHKLSQSREPVNERLAFVRSVLLEYISQKLKKSDRER